MSVMFESKVNILCVWTPVNYVVRVTIGPGANKTARGLCAVTAAVTKKNGGDSVIMRMCYGGC